MADPHRELEHLRQLAAAKPTERFGKLLQVRRHNAILQMGWQKVRTNPGSRTPGVDGHTKEDVAEHVLHDLAPDLATRHSRPQPVRRTYNPQRGQPGPRRGLGRPAIRD